MTASSPLPPRYVEYTSLPVGSNLATKPSPVLITGWLLSLAAPPYVFWYGLSVGKSLERVAPPTYTLPEPSRAMAVTTSSRAPPRYVEKTSAVPAAFSSATQPSPQLTSVPQEVQRGGLPPRPLKVDWYGFLVGKLVESVSPPT